VVTASGARFTLSKCEREDTLSLVSASANLPTQLLIVRARFQDVESIPDRLDRLEVARGEEGLSHARIVPHYGANANKTRKNGGVFVVVSRC
jgi:hypothetical protein